MGKARNIANLVDANGDVIASALDNVPAANLIDDTTPQLGGNLDTNGNNITFNDNDRAIFGDGSDLQIYHDVSHSYIVDNGTGNLRIKAQNFQVLGNADDEAQIEAYQNDGVYLYFNGNQKLATTSGGIDVTGTVTADGVSLGDSEYIYLGASNDIQIYHDGLNSFIKDAGTGSLRICGDELKFLNSGDNQLKITADTNGAVKLYYSGTQKLSTTNTGVDVTGTVTADGLTMDGDITQSGAGTQTISLERVGASKLDIGASTAGVGNFITATTNDLFVKRTASSTKVIGVSNSTGDISFYDDTGVTQGFFWDASAESLGIGTASPSTKLDVSGGFNATDSIQSLGVYNNTTGTGANLVVDSGGGFARSTSSLRYKNTVNDATHGLTELLALRPVTYKGNNDGDTVFGGLIAEEVHDAGLTEFVTYNEDGEPDALAYGNMVSLCIKAIQEQQATITALEARIAALEAN